MTVDTALQIIEKFKQEELERYNESPDSKDSNGNRIPHPLDNVSEDDELFALDVSLKNVALKTIPQTLIESVSDSTADVFKRISKDYFVRVPRYPQKGQNLDIDNGLAYAVVFFALAEIYSGFNSYGQKADVICNEYNNAMRKVIDDILSGATPDKVTYIRFSADGQNWHDSYQDGDIYISFKRVDTDPWTPAIRFVGKDGQPCSDTQFTALEDTPASYAGAGGKIVAVKSSEDGVEFVDPPSGGGGGATTFKDLTDTPGDYAGAKGKKVVVKQTEDGLEFESDTFTSLDDTPADYSNAGGKFVAVKSDASGLEFVDAPSGSGTVKQFGDNPFYSEDTGSIQLDTQTYNSFYLYPSGNLTIQFKKFDDGSNQNASALFGTVYTFVVVNGGFDIAFDSSETFYGDASILKDTSKDYPLTLIRAYYDGYKWIVVDRVEVPDYQP